MFLLCSVKWYLCARGAGRDIWGHRVQPFSTADKHDVIPFITRANSHSKKWLVLLVFLFFSTWFAFLSSCSKVMPNLTFVFWACIYFRLVLPVILLGLALVSTFFVFLVSGSGKWNPQEKSTISLYLCILTTEPTSAWLDNFEIQANDNYIGHNRLNWTSEVAINKKTLLEQEDFYFIKQFVIRSYGSWRYL